MNNINYKDQTLYTIDKLLPIINELRKQQDKVLWKVDKNDSKFTRNIAYRITDINGNPINPLLGMKFRKYKAVVDMLSIACVLLQEDCIHNS